VSSPLQLAGVCFKTLTSLTPVSSAADYLELLKVLLNDGTGTNGAQILKPETIKQMWVVSLTSCGRWTDEPGSSTSVPPRLTKEHWARTPGWRVPMGARPPSR